MPHHRALNLIRSWHSTAYKLYVCSCCKGISSPFSIHRYKADCIDSGTQQHLLGEQVCCQPLAWKAAVDPVDWLERAEIVALAFKQDGSLSGGPTTGHHHWAWVEWPTRRERHGLILNHQCQLADFPSEVSWDHAVLVHPIGGQWVEGVIAPEKVDLATRRACKAVSQFIMSLEGISVGHPDISFWQYTLYHGEWVHLSEWGINLWLHNIHHALLRCLQAKELWRKWDQAYSHSLAVWAVGWIHLGWRLLNTLPDHT